MKIDSALVHCNVTQIYFDHRHVHIRRTKLSFHLSTVCLFLKVTTVAHIICSISPVKKEKKIGRPMTTAELDCKEKKNILKREV